MVDLASKTTTDHSDQLFRLIEDLEPRLIDVESQRRDYQQRFFKRVIAVWVTAAAFAVAGWVLVPEQQRTWLLAIPVVAALASIWAWSPAREFREKVQSAMLEPMCRLLGLTHSQSGDDLEVEPYGWLGVVPNFTQSKVEDVFTGTTNGCGHRLATASFSIEEWDGKERKTKNVFRGLILEVDLPTRLEGRALIGRDHGRVGNKLASWGAALNGTSPVRFVDAEFETRFEVYATNPESTRYCLNDSVRAALVRLSEEHGFKAVQAAMEDRVLRVALSANGEPFHAGSIFRLVDARSEEVRKVLKWLSLPRRFVSWSTSPAARVSG